MTECNPFRHHPELRGKIKPASESYFRDMDIAALDARAAQSGFPEDWRTPCDEREAARRDWLEGRLDQDLWVFGYGSLMWDPAFEFIDVRHAHCQGFQRSFCLWDERGRGSVEQPGLMLALDQGANCEGLAFCIEAEKIDHETFVLFRREMISGAYQPTWLRLETAQGIVEALGFVANHEHERIRPGIPLPDQARMISHAEGALGTNFDYLANAHKSLDFLDIEDPYISELYKQATSLRQMAE